MSSALTVLAGYVLCWTHMGGQQARPPRVRTVEWTLESKTYTSEKRNFDVSLIRFQSKEKVLSMLRDSCELYKQCWTEAVSCCILSNEEKKQGSKQLKMLGGQCILWHFLNHIRVKAASVLLVALESADHVRHRIINVTYPELLGVLPTWK